MKISRRTACAALLAGGVVRGQSAASPFEGHEDVGTVLHPGGFEYDAGAGAYTIAGSGENVWATADAFHFVWKKVSGDFSLAADISFPTSTGNAHKKGMLMFRQSLDADSAYADVALHNEGLTSLQSRAEKGSATHEVQAAVSAPKRLRIAKHGADFFLALGDGGGLKFAGPCMRVALAGTYYVGLGVCSHDKDVVEKAVFRNVELAPVPASIRLTPYSVIETVTVSSTDRRVTWYAPEHLEKPAWSDDGTAIIFTRGGRTAKVAEKGGTPEAGDRPTGAATAAQDYTYSDSDRSGSRQIWRALPDGTGQEQWTPDDMQNILPQLSPNGRQLAFLSYGKETRGLPSNQEVTIRVMNLANKEISAIAKLNGGAGSLDAGCWSPDGRRLTYISYPAAP